MTRWYNGKIIFGHFPWSESRERLTSDGSLHDVAHTEETVPAALRNSDLNHQRRVIIEGINLAYKVLSDQTPRAKYEDQFVEDASFAPRKSSRSELSEEDGSPKLWHASANYHDEPRADELLEKLLPTGVSRTSLKLAASAAIGLALLVFECPPYVTATFMLAVLFTAVREIQLIWIDKTAAEINEDRVNAQILSFAWSDLHWIMDPKARGMKFEERCAEVVQMIGWKTTLTASPHSEVLPSHLPVAIQMHPTSIL